MGSRVGSPGMNSKRRMHSRSPLVRSPKSVLLPESLDSASESSSLASSILGEQIVECTSSFRMAAKVKESDAKTAPEARFEHVDNHTWFASIDRPSDLLVEVDDISFHLHKLPLLSRSGLLFRLASQSRDTRKAYINLVDVPGGAEAFMVVVKFCYGIVEELTPTNVATIRCCAEYLEMTEVFEEGNVVSKAEAYLNLVILNSWQESIIVLQSCELLLPWAEEMSLVKRCAQSVALKACTDPSGVRWLYSGAEKQLPGGSPDGGAGARVLASHDWWYEDVSHLTVFCFREVVEAIKDRGMDAVLLGGAVEHYAQRWLPGLITKQLVPTTTSSAASTRRSSPMSSPRKLIDVKTCPSRATIVTMRTNQGLLADGAESPRTSTPHDAVAEQDKNRIILEEIVTLLPHERDAVSCSFLLRMTRGAHMLNCDADCKAELERQAGLQLDRGTLSDLLIPSFSHTSEYLYDIDLVRRLLEHFLSQEQSVECSPRSCSSDRDCHACGVYDGPTSSGASKLYPLLNLRTRVAKLLDSYLAEVARDCKLPLGKFQSLAEALPEGSRLCDDGLYRAVDTYLKIHPTLSEHERKRLCRILNCHRLSLDACTHASQNERLPLRFVVQVLFCEQLKIRSTVTEVTNSVKGDHRIIGETVGVASARESVAGTDVASPQSSASTSSTPAAATREAQALQESVNQMEIRALQRELATMRVKWNDLERDHNHIQEQVEHISRTSSSRTSSWSSGAWRKITKLHLFNNHHNNPHHVPGDSSRTDESRTTIPRRWRNSIS